MAADGRSIANDPVVKQIRELLAGESDGNQDDDPGGDSQSADNDLGRARSGSESRGADIAKGRRQAESETLDDDPSDEETDFMDGDDPEPGSGGDDEPEGVTVAQLAKKLGIEAKDLYNDLLIPMPEGKKITLGQFKDRVRDLQTLDADREKYKSDFGEWEKAQMRDRLMLNEMLQLIGPDIARPAYAAAQKRLESWSNEQRDEVLKAIPEWNKPAVLERDRDQIVKMGAEYGFSETEMIYTQDARTIRMLRDFAKLRERNAKPDLRGKEKRATPGRPGAGKHFSQRSKLAKVVANATESRSDTTKARGIAALLASHGVE